MTKFTKNEMNSLHANGFTVGRCSASKYFNGGVIVICKIITGGYTRQILKTENGTTKFQPYERFDKFRDALNG